MKEEVRRKREEVRKKSGMDFRLTCSFFSPASSLFGIFRFPHELPQRFPVRDQVRRLAEGLRAHAGGSPRASAARERRAAESG